MLAMSLRDGGLKIPTDHALLQQYLSILSTGACHPTCPWPFLAELVCKAALTLFHA